MNQLHSYNFDMVGVTGSIPVVPTTQTSRKPRLFQFCSTLYHNRTLRDKRRTNRDSIRKVVQNVCSRLCATAYIFILYANPVNAQEASASIGISAGILNRATMSVHDALESCAESNRNGYYNPCPAICEKADNETRFVWCESEGLCCDRIEPAAGDVVLQIVDVE